MLSNLEVIYLKNHNNMSYKKLTRSKTDKKIAGVCGGIAQYMECDPTVVRIIFLIALLCGSLGFWAYLIVWLVAPEANE